MTFHRNSDIYKFQIKLAASLHSRSIRVPLSLYALSVFLCHAFHLRTVRLSLLFVVMKIIFRGSRGGSLVTNTQTTRIKDSQVNKLTYSIKKSPTSEATRIAQGGPA